MADATGNDPKPTGSKPGASKGGTRPGPVKPPALDLKAREASAKADAAKPEPAKQDIPPKPAPGASTIPPSRPAGRPKTPATAGKGPVYAGTAIAGGVLGLAAAYGLAWFGLWPTIPAQPAEPDPRLTGLYAAIPELETVTQTTQAELATLNQRIGALEAAGAGAPDSTETTPVDLSAIEADIATLAQRLDALPHASAETNVAALRAELAAIDTRLDELGARIGSTESGLRSLDVTVSETSAALASQPSDIGAVLQLPLILSGLETAFPTGRPYETELAALRNALPDAAIPTAIANKAASGLTRPDIIAARFAQVLPAMLARRPANPNAHWQDNALDWFRSAIALRPTGEIEGDSLEAVISRLEAAMARRDFVTAQTLLESLPAPMLAATGDVPALIAGQAEATRFLEILRSSALAGEAVP
jgi:hypothetical protein